MKHKMDWVPVERIGPFRFENSIEEYLDKYHLVKVPEEFDEDVGWHVYSTDAEGDFRIYVEEGSIVGIACYSDCWLNGVNLIGKTISEVVTLIGFTPCVDKNTIEIDEEQESIFEFEQVDAQVWVRQGKIVAVICGVPEPS